MKYDESANNQVVTVQRNDAFELVLPEARTTGYRWTLKQNRESACTLLADESQPNPAGIGGAGHHSWKFRATSPGVCEIELHSTRPWENASEPARTFRMKVLVRL